MLLFASVTPNRKYRYKVEMSAAFRNEDKVCYQTDHERASAVFSMCCATTDFCHTRLITFCYFWITSILNMVTYFSNLVSV